MAVPAPDPNNIGFCEPWPPTGGAGKVKVRDEDSVLATLPNDANATSHQKRHAHPRHAPALSSRDRLVGAGRYRVASNASLMDGSQHETDQRASWNSASSGLTVRQLSGGSYLDPNVYAFLDCSNDDYDPCQWGEACGDPDGSDDGDGFSFTSTDLGTTTPSAATTESSAVTTTSSLSTTEPVTTRTTTIYVLSTKTTTLTSQSTSTIGVLRVSANVRTEAVLNAVDKIARATTAQSRATLAPRANIVVSDYNLNYYPSPAVESTVHPCSAGNFDVYGVGTPKPKHWNDFPATVPFVSTISLDNGDKLSSCSYTNAAAPSLGDGGKVFCGASTYQCSLFFGHDVFSCNHDALVGYLTTMLVLAECGVATTTADVITTTTVITVATSVSRITS